MPRFTVISGEIRLAHCEEALASGRLQRDDQFLAFLKKARRLPANFGRRA
jgi:hypothetical protein